ncbi:LINE-1 reverse transcriptase-like [Holothuria leucospilota]|uniref:LINE-1 reverse transcriptase-like n=1 Tax=Holothuria leucospilota TaxID=206669 RepID=A0A9Q1BNN1_HOLLE|nr:LINE-1 reverse transcriptase-like [Holothuria leucospilota]
MELPQYGIPSLKHEGKTITDAKLKADLLNNYFTSVFTLNNHKSIPDKGPPPLPPMPCIVVTAPGVLKLLSELKTRKAIGPDKIPSVLLKTVANEITPVIVSFFQQSLNTGIFPDKLKKANVTPIPKKGSKADVKNYPPISLTSILSKCLEHIMVSNFMSHLESNSILTPYQHGFRKHRSTVTQRFAYM